MTSPLTVAMATHPGDKSHALQVLRWIDTLGCCRKSEIVLFIQEEHRAGMAIVMEAAAKAFARCNLGSIARFPWPPKWPHGQNWAFLAALDHPWKTPFLWMEPDSFPIREGWLEQLASEYWKAGKPWMGTIIRSNRTGLPVEMLNGVAIHPAHAGKSLKETILGNKSRAWDVVCAGIIVPSAHDSKQFQTLLPSPNGPVKISKLSYIEPSTTLFHGDKFGLLLRKLMGSRKPAAGVKAEEPSIQSEAAAEPVAVLEDDDSLVESRPACDVTVVITNYRRPEHLWLCFESCRKVGVPRLVISSSGESAKLKAVHRRIKEAMPQVSVSSRKGDAGCNETWLRGVQMAGTSKVVILHDDDWIMPAFKRVLDGRFDDADVAHWDGAKHMDFDPIEGLYVTRNDWPAGIHPMDYLLTFLLCPDSHTLSPVSGMFPRQFIIETLEECDREFGLEFHTRPTMMVGNDLMLWLRACDKFKTVRYTHMPMISYGHGNQSESFRDAGGGTMKLRTIYNRTRDYWLNHTSRLFHGMSRYAFSDSDALKRFQLAETSWCFAYEHGVVVPVPCWNTARLSSDVRDTRKLPFLKDILAFTMKNCTRDDDIVCLTNDDTIVNIYWWYRARAELKSRGALCSVRHDLHAGEWQPCDVVPKTVVGHRQAGRDAFAFRLSWLKEHWSEIPDYLIGYGDWDSTLAMLIRLTHGDKPLPSDFTKDMPSSEIPAGMIHHVAHSPKWIATGLEAPGQKYNRELTMKFFKERLGWEMPHLRGAW